MSGTSADGLDACLVDFTRAGPRVRAHVSSPFDAELRAALLAAMHACDLANAADLDVALADLMAEAVRELLASADVRAGDVRAIGSHGQTLLHRPRGSRPTSIQIGDPHRLAVRTGIDVVADFRRADLAAGGEGAPLAPAFHAAAFHRRGEHRAVVNIGGMANLTILPGDPAATTGFDTGPGNALLDLWSHRSAGEPFDHQGERAARGHVLAPLLDACLAEPFFQARPPKSTGREQFNAEWLEHKLHQAAAMDADPADVQATLAELTARTISEHLGVHAPQTTSLFVCGGGAGNDDLMRRLSRLLPHVRVESTRALGLPPGQVESVAFAWLARQRILGRAGNLPAVTGAVRPLVLGALIRAPR